MKRLQVGLLIGLLGGLYVWTMPSSVYLEDSGELIAAADRLGIAHPSGYPLYVLLGKVFGFLPAGGAAFRLNLMSAVFGAAAAILLFLVLRELASELGASGQRYSWIAFLFALSFGVGRDFWSQSIIAEVYTLNSFLVGVFVYLYFRWRRERKLNYLYWLAVLSGFGMTDHFLFAFILPAAWIAIFWEGGFKRLSFRSLEIIVLLFFLGLTPYLYIPLRASMHPAINFGQIQTFNEAIRHILRISYHDFAPGIAHRGLLINGFFHSLLDNLTWLATGLAVLGLFWLVKARQIKLVFFIFAAFFSSAFLPIVFRSDAYLLAVTDFLSRVYYFQGYFFLFLAAGAFVFSLKKFPVVWLFILFGLSSYLIFHNLPLENLRHSPVAGYYQDELKSFPPNAVYLLVGWGYDYDSELFTLLYLQKVEGLRPDVRIIDGSRVFYAPPPKAALPAPPSVAAWRSQYLHYVISVFGPDAVIYSSFPVEKYTDEFISLPTPYAFRVLGKSAAEPKTAVAVPKSSVPESNPLKRQTWDLAYRDFLAGRDYHDAAYLWYQGDSKAATRFLVNALRYDNEIPSEDYLALQKFRAELTDSRK